MILEYTQTAGRRHTWTVSVLFTLIFTLLLFALLRVPAAQAENATLKIDPAQGTFFVGSTFDVAVILNTGGETINAVEAELRFPPNLLQVTTPTAASSFVTIWTSPPTYSNQEGYVRFQGGIPSPGLKTSSGVLSGITFRAVQPGTATLHFTGNSRVLRHDGTGTNILGSTFGARYEIAIPPPQGPIVSSPTHPEYAVWYRDSSPTFSWEKAEGVSEFSWTLDHDPNSVPDIKPEGTETAVTYGDFEDGLWYFHIRANKEGVWGGTTTFLAKIDTTPPAEFTIKIDPGKRIVVGTRALVAFRTTDNLSGVSRHELKIVDVSGPNATARSPFFLEAESPFVMPDLDAGIFTVVVRAYDNAGNFQESSTRLEITTRVFALFTEEGVYLGFATISWLAAMILSGLSAVLGVFLAFRFWKRHRKVREYREAGVEDLRQRLREGLERIHARIKEDADLEKKYAYHLSALDHFREGSPTREKESNSKRAAMILFFVLPVAVWLSFSSYSARAQSDHIALAAPRITTTQLEIASNQLLYLSGVASPGSTVRIYIEGEQYEPIITEVLADERGDWEHLHSLYLHPGLYDVSVESQDPEGNVSARSDVAPLRVASRSLSIGQLTIGFEALLGFIIIAFLLFAAILLAISVWYRSRADVLHQDLRREVHEAATSVRLGFVLFRRQLEEDLGILEKAREGPRREFLGKEREVRSALLADLQNIEERIVKEIADVEALI